jgi:hypothetical protein
LLDFGLAKGMPLHMTRVTSSGSIYGYTPSYAPMEQIQGSTQHAIAKEQEKFLHKNLVGWLIAFVILALLLIALVRVFS